jgi:hypothetical protein
VHGRNIRAKCTHMGQDTGSSGCKPGFNATPVWIPTSKLSIHRMIRQDDGGSRSRSPQLLPHLPVPGRRRLCSLLRARTAKHLARLVELVQPHSMKRQNMDLCSPRHRRMWGSAAVHAATRALVHQEVFAADEATVPSWHVRPSRGWTCAFKV